MTWRRRDRRCESPQSERHRWSGEVETEQFVLRFDDVHASLHTDDMNVVKSRQKAQEYPKAERDEDERCLPTVEPKSIGVDRVEDFGEHVEDAEDGCCHERLSKS